jgi:hypothetical protein
MIHPSDGAVVFKGGRPHRDWYYQSRAREVQLMSENQEAYFRKKQDAFLFNFGDILGNARRHVIELPTGVPRHATLEVLNNSYCGD